MVRERLGVFVGTAEGFDPFRGAAMLLGPIRSGNLPIGDVANEDVQERVLGVVRHRRRPRTLHEALSIQSMESRLRYTAIAAVHNSAEPEDFAQNGCVLKQGFLVLSEPIEARRDDSLHGLRHR